jgi:DNA-binding NarL/FixJ family response regulator
MVMTRAATATVMMVDDHPLFRKGLAVALRAVEDLDVVAEASSAAEALEVLAERSIDVAVIDILMPSVSGISLAADIYERQPSCVVLGLSVIDDTGLIADLFRAHA